VNTIRSRANRSDSLEGPSRSLHRLSVPRNNRKVHRVPERRVPDEIERFNRTLRNEFLDQRLFVRLGEFREAAYW
jgi:hypothetical protein